MTAPAGRDHAGRTHSLAPPHLGEVQAAATLVIGVLGVAIFITGVGVVVAGLTVSGGYDSANPPPNANGLGTAQIVGGFGLFVLGLVLAGGSAGLMAGGVRARVPIAVLAVLSGAAAMVGGAFIIARAPSDLVLAIALFGLGISLIGAGLLLLRSRT